MDKVNWEDIVNLAKSVKNLLGSEVAVSVTNLEKFVYYEPGFSLDHKIQVDDPIKIGTPTHEVTRTAQRVARKITNLKLFGIVYLAVVAPLYSTSGELIGTIGTFRPTTTQDSLIEDANKLDTSIEIINQTTTAVSESSQQLAATASNLSEQSNLININVQKTDVIMSLIKDVAAQTHLLGLNAAIEAARAGEHGRGFNVVAEEIRKLATRTTGSVKETTNILSIIQHSVETLGQQIQEIAAVAEEQSASVEEIAASVNNIVSMSKDLNELANKLE